MKCKECGTELEYKKGYLIVTGEYNISIDCRHRFCSKCNKATITKGEQAKIKLKYDKEVELIKGGKYETK